MVLTGAAVALAIVFGAGKETEGANAAVEAVREAAHRYLESEASEHRHEHKQRDGRLCDALILHPRRNKRVEGAANKPA